MIYLFLHSCVVYADNIAVEQDIGETNSKDTPVVVLTTNSTLNVNEDSPQNTMQFSKMNETLVSAVEPILLSEIEKFSTFESGKMTISPDFIFYILFIFIIYALDR